MRSERHRKRFSKRIVMLAIRTMLLYTAAAFYFTWHGRYVPDSLTYSFFAAFSVELSALAGIRIKEKYYEGKEGH